MTHTAEWKEVLIGHVFRPSEFLIISQGQKEPRRYRDNICVTTHGVWCIEWCLDADTAGGRDPHPAAIRRIQNGIDRRARSNLAMLV